MYPIFYYDSERPVDLICMGRVAVDLYAEQIGCALKDASTFKKYLGGCAGNIAVGTSRLGLNSMMFSCVGQDEMGAFIKQELIQEGVSIQLLMESKDHLTGLVLLGINPPDKFPLMFYRNNCADMQLKPEHIDDLVLKQSKAILITGTGLSTESMRQSTLDVVLRARANETLVLLDLDYRPVLWGLTDAGNGESRYQSCAQVSRMYQLVLPHCDLIVGTEEELCIAGGHDDVSMALETIRALTDAPIVIKSGEKGACVRFANQSAALVSKPFSVEVLNVLGAGDGFMSGLLSGLLRGKGWERALAYANASGALVVTRHGCAPAIPYLDELEYFIKAFDANPLVWNSPFLEQMHQRLSKKVHSSILIKNSSGFSTGVNSIVKMDQPQIDMGMNFTSVKLSMNDVFQFNPDYEFAALLMTGKVVFCYEKTERQVERSDYFSQAPVVLHCAQGSIASVRALTDCEVLLIETENDQQFETILFDESNMLELDDRGKNILDDTSYRIVRTVFDKRNRPQSNLVVGEIITFQGRWSSYPSHYHEQPEIYHYRFSEPQGYAFGEHGKEVLRIEHYDTYQITSGQEHAHCTAPGYALYTLWFIRHLKDNPYITPTFRKEHEWTRTAKANSRVWRKN